MADTSATGDVYAEHTARLLADEYDRRKILETRGDSIIKTSAAVIALIFGLTVFISGKDYRFTNHWFSIGFLAASLVTFVLSAAIAIYVQNWGLKYTTTGKKTLQDMTRDLWDLDTPSAKRMCLQRIINTTITLREGNDKKAAAAQYSVILQVIAILLLGIALVFELTGTPAPAAPTPNPTVCVLCND